MRDTSTHYEPRPLWRNVLTYIGAVTVLVALMFIVSFLFLDLIVPAPNPYIGLFTFLIFPACIVVGIGLVLIGLLFARIRRNGSPGSEPTYYPRIDMNLPSHRRVVEGLGVAFLVAVPFIGFMSYEGYHYSDSNNFCGQVCHTVMQPQYTAHKKSPHARVECATCHIGTGASWYVKSKLSGLRQVMAVTTDSYPRPIPPAIRELRPARETCEQCHWPEKFYGDQLVTFHHFETDEASTPRPIQMLVRTGGADPSTGPPSGIHWHMALGHTIEYVATDEGLQDVAWVRDTDHYTGQQVIYRADGRKSTDPLPEGIQRTMDCMDCHNRATHIFRSPAASVDDALNADPSLRKLPYAKREMVAALSKPYDDRAVASQGIGAQIANFYQKNYPDVLTENRDEFDRMIDRAREIYGTTFFPAMNVTWRTYPNNIGHLEYPGCFRCHDGRHVDDQGNAISRSCSSCHEFLVPGKGENANALVRGGTFVHPIELKGTHASLRCDKCHGRAVQLSPTCEGCHTDVSAFLSGETPAFQSYEISAGEMDGLADCTDCHDLDKPTTLATVTEACLTCHDAADGFDATLADWQVELDRLFAAAEANKTPEAEATIQALRAAGPMHNMEASRTILKSLADQAGQVTADTAGTVDEHEPDTPQETGAE